MYDLGDSRLVRHILNMLIAHLSELIAFRLSEFYCVLAAYFSCDGARVKPKVAGYVPRRKAWKTDHRFFCSRPWRSDGQFRPGSSICTHGGGPRHERPERFDHRRCGSGAGVCLGLAAGREACPRTIPREAMQEAIHSERKRIVSSFTIPCVRRTQDRSCI